MRIIFFVRKLLLVSVISFYFAVGANTAAAASTNIVINEIYYNVENEKGGDPDGEWIELYNGSPSNIDLKDWTLSDNSAARLISSESLILSPGNYCLIGRNNKIWPLWNIDAGRADLRLVEINARIGNGLGNSGDLVVIKDNFGQIVDQVSWGSNTTYFNLPKTAKGFSLSRLPDSTDRDLAEDFSGAAKPTPGNTNRPSPPKSTKPTKEFSYLLDFDMPISLSLARSFPLNEDVFVRGTVAVPPGILSRNSFYIIDDTAAIQIYSYAKDYPSLRTGDTITVSGVTAESSGEKRIKIQNAQDIEIVSPIRQLSPKEFEIGKINEEAEGRYVKVRGEIAETSGDTFSVMDNGQIKIVIRELTGIKKPAMRRGDLVEIAGIVSQYKNEYRILPFLQEDVKIINPIPAGKIGGRRQTNESAGQQSVLPAAGLPEKYCLWGALISGSLWSMLLVTKKRLIS